jgi:hypothetical protein
MVSVDGEGKLEYNANFQLGIASVGVRGSIDVEALILACSGLLCRAARLLNGRSAQQDSSKKRWGIDMKAKLAVSIFFVLASVACAQQSSTLSAEQQYRAFKHALMNDQRNVRYEHYLSDYLVTLFESAESAKERAQLEAQSEFPRWLAVEHSWYEKTTASGRCLTVTGETPDKTPGMVIVEFILQQEKLKADAIHYQYLKSPENFPSEAICPHELELKLPS